MASLGKLLRAASSRRLACRAPKAVLSTKRCLAIAKRLSDIYLSALPAKSQQLTKQVKKGLVAKGKRHLQPEKATNILGKAMCEINAGLQKLVEEASSIVDGADAEHEARIAAASAADAELAQLRQSVADCSRTVKESWRNIEKRKAEIGEAKMLQQSRTAHAKKVQSKKRQLEVIEKESYEPLKYSAAEGPDGAKRLAVLRRTGKAYGFHKDLLSIAPVILRKPLDSRHTFEDLVVRQLASEFNKNSSSLGADVKRSEYAIVECAQQVETAEAGLADAKLAHKQATRALSLAEAAVVQGSLVLAEAKTGVRKLPADLKRAERNLAQAESRLFKFQQGPRAAFESALGLEYGSMSSMAEGLCFLTSSEQEHASGARHLESETA